ETLSRMLKYAGIPHEVLNAKNHQREAEIVARAGQRGSVTVSTNMAGRGTDIKLGEGVADLGGLFVLGTERYESRRIDRQLRGRCSRQGDPGASQFFLSFEDDLMRNFGGSERMTKAMNRFGMAEGEAVESWMMNKIIEGAQKRVEQRNYMWRKHVLDYDDVMNQQRTIVYAMRNDALLCEEPREMIYEQLTEGIHTKCEDYLNEDNTGAIRRLDLLHWLNSTFPLGWSEEDAALNSGEPSEVADRIVARVREMYEKKVAGERPDRVDHMERNIMLQAIDKLWQQHIMDMDALREGVRLRAQGQRDPLVEYKREAYSIFETLISNIQYEILNNLFRSTTNLSAFEDFLSSLPASNADDEDESVTDVLGNGDFLSMLREQMARMQKRFANAPAAADADVEAEDDDDDAEEEEEAVGAYSTSDAAPAGMLLPEEGSVSGAPMPGIPMKPEKKMVLPKKKVTANIKRKDSSAPLVMSSLDMEESVPGVSMSLIDGEPAEGTTVSGAEEK
ncbi:MAG: hypothetical protein IKC90_04550, partial [Akkermansia sp.]|nr:hypothetical protein [Akkermansia sp.]